MNKIEKNKRNLSKDNSLLYNNPIQIVENCMDGMRIHDISLKLNQSDDQKTQFTPQLPKKSLLKKNSLDDNPSSGSYIWGKNGLLNKKSLTKYEHLVKKFNSHNNTTIASNDIQSNRLNNSLFTSNNNQKTCHTENTSLDKTNPKNYLKRMKNLNFLTQTNNPISKTYDVKNYMAKSHYQNTESVVKTSTDDFKVINQNLWASAFEDN